MTSFLRVESDKVYIDAEGNRQGPMKLLAVIADLDGIRTLYVAGEKCWDDAGRAEGGDYADLVAEPKEHEKSATAIRAGGKND